MNRPKKLSNFKEFVKEYGDIDGKEDSKKTPCIILAGPPGCGKGTQARIIAKGTRWKHISTGDILRDSDNKEIKKLMKTGNLLPDEIVGKELIDYLKKLTKHNDPKGYIFDGYPRNLQQKAIFEEICRINNISLEYVFFLNVAEKILRERIKERETDRQREKLK